VIAAELTRQGAAPDAFTVIFDGDETDLPYAQAVAQHLGLHHEILCAEGGSLDARAQATIEQYDEPFADSSAVACLTLAGALGNRYKVILNGDGGDEAFAGYRHYEYIAVKQALKATAAAAGFRDGHASSTTYVQSKTTFRTAERSALLNGHGPSTALDQLLTTDPYLRNPRSGALKRALWSDRHLHLANGLTFKTDMAMAAHAIEGRAPLLDHRILEWAQNLDNRDLVRGREKKIQLRDAYAAELPAEVLTRAKHGFGAPFGQWLAGPLREMAESVLPCPLLDRESQRGQTSQRQWTLFAFALWAKQWRASW
jgi:asparagine synthase (glutamine-hydrolysing)